MFAVKKADFDHIYAGHPAIRQITRFMKLSSSAMTVLSTKKEAGSLKKTDFRSHFADGFQTIWTSQV
jgi:hypothetical protein